MLHCWVLHQHNQKWLTRKDEAPPKRQKSRNSSLQFEGFQDVVDDGVLDEDRRGGSPTASSEAPTRTRPPGRKAEKEKLKRGAAGGTYKEVFQEMLTKREEMEAHKEARWIEVKAMEERKAAFKERKVAMHVSWQHRWVVLKVGLRMEVMVFDELCHGRMVALLLIITLLLILPFA